MTAVLINPYMIAVAGDPNFAGVMLLLHLDGTNGSTTITDNSSAARTCSAVGGTLSTAQQKFGTASFSCGGSHYVSTADNAAWDFGAGQFTVECWIRLNSSRVGVSNIMSQWSGSTITQAAWQFGFSSNALAFWYSTTGTDSPNVSGAYTPALNTWIHVAADRDAGNVLRVYADGAVIASATVSATFFNSNRTLRIGNDEGGIRGLGGFIDEVRITKGVARYGGAFTPPTAPFPNS
jgi:hypothetical protein